MSRFLSAFLILVLAAPVASAQDDGSFEGQQPTRWPEFEDAPEGAPDARIAFVFDPVSQRREAAIEVGVPVEVFLVAWDVQVALMAWEARLEFDERLILVAEEYHADLHFKHEGDTRATLKAENCVAAPQIILARFELLLMGPDAESAQDLVLGIAPASVPSKVTAATPQSAPVPVYQVCRPG
ncbi:hypothetical protein DRQ32_11415, partial [bacterium]